MDVFIPSAGTCSHDGVNHLIALAHKACCIGCMWLRRTTLIGLSAMAQSTLSVLRFRRPPTKLLHQTASSPHPPGSIPQAGPQYITAEVSERLLQTPRARHFHPGHQEMGQARPVAHTPPSTDQYRSGCAGAAGLNHHGLFPLGIDDI
jgi:hypothetical protein